MTLWKKLRRKKPNNEELQILINKHRLKYSNYRISTIFPNNKIENLLKFIEKLELKYNLNKNSFNKDKIIILIYNLCPRHNFYPLYFSNLQIALTELDYKSEYYFDFFKINNLSPSIVI